MNQASSFNQFSDIYGSLASILCIIHCLATPLLFMASASDLTGTTLTPWWWHLLDFVFITISFVAIRQSIRTSTISWMPLAMYSSWIVLSVLIIIDKTSFITLPGNINFLPAISLVFLHFYHLLYHRFRRGSHCLHHLNKKNRLTNLKVNPEVWLVIELAKVP